MTTSIPVDKACPGYGLRNLYMIQLLTLPIIYPLWSWLLLCAFEEWLAQTHKNVDFDKKVRLTKWTLHPRRKSMQVTNHSWEEIIWQQNLRAKPVWARTWLKLINIRLLYFLSRTPTHWSLKKQIIEEKLHVALIFHGCQWSNIIEHYVWNELHLMSQLGSIVILKVR
jgi:hypothetical protein